MPGLSVSLGSQGSLPVRGSHGSGHRENLETSPYCPFTTDLSYRVDTGNVGPTTADSVKLSCDRQIGPDEQCQITSCSNLFLDFDGATVVLDIVSRKHMAWNFYGPTG